MWHIDRVLTKTNDLLSSTQTTIQYALWIVCEKFFSVKFWILESLAEFIVTFMQSTETNSWNDSNMTSISADTFNFMLKFIKFANILQPK